MPASPLNGSLTAKNINNKIVNNAADEMIKDNIRLDLLPNPAIPVETTEQVANKNHLNTFSLDFNNEESTTIPDQKLSRYAVIIHLQQRKFNLYLV